MQASPPADLFDQSGTIVLDLSCRRCAYNLRGLRQEGRCPECGTPVGRSTHGDLLQFSDPAWIATLERGIQVMTWGILLAFVSGLLGGLLAATLGAPVLAAVCGVLGGMLVLYQSGAKLV